MGERSSALSGEGRPALQEHRGPVGGDHRHDRGGYQLGGEPPLPIRVRTVLRMLASSRSDLLLRTAQTDGGVDAGDDRGVSGNQQLLDIQDRIVAESPHFPQELRPLSFRRQSGM